MSLKKTSRSGVWPDRFEVTWLSGHVEVVEAHQVAWPGSLQPGPQRITFMAEIRGRWTLVLSACEDDLRTVRRITDGEHIAPTGGAA